MHITNTMNLETDTEAIFPAKTSRYQSILDNQPEFICRYDTQFRLTFVNRAYSEWRGQSPTELLGSSSLAHFVAAEQAQVVADAQALTVASPTAVSIHPSPHPDQPDCLIEWTVRALFDDNGRCQEYQSSGRDVTEQERRIRQLQATQYDLEISRRHLQGVLETMQDALLSTSLPERQLVFVSASFEQVFGYPVERFLRDPDFFRQIVHPADLQRTLVVQEACLRQGLAEVEHRIILPDGQVRWLHRRAWVNYDENGRPIRVHDSAHDITERKQAEEALRASEEKYRSLVESSDAAITLVDAQGIYLYLNQIATAPFGVPPNALVGKHVRELFPPEQAEAVMWDVQQVLTASQGKILETEVTLGGRACWFRTSLQPVRDGAGHPYAVLIHANETTEKKLVEQAIRQQNEILQQSHDFISSAGTDGRVIYMNKAGATLMGADDPAVLIGKPIADFHTPEEAERILQHVLPLAVQNGQWQGESQIKTLDGRLLDVDQTIFPIRDEKGQIIRYATILSDITVHKQAELALRHSEERFQQFMRHLPGAVFIKDAAGHMVYCNERYAQFSGSDPADLLGKSTTEYLPPQIAASFIHENEQVLAAGQAMEFSHIFPGPNGLSYLLTIKFPIPQENQPPLLGAISLDVTKEKQVEAALQEAYALLEQRVIERTAELEKVKNRLEAIFNHSGDAIVLLDIHRGIQQANYAFDAMFGISVGQYLETKLSAWFQPDDAITIEAISQRTLATHEIQRMELRAKRPDDTKLDVEISIAPVNRSDQAVTSLVCIIRDISQRKQAEEALRESEASYQSVVETQAELICRYQPDLTLTFVNNAYCRYFNTTPEQMVGRSFLELVPEAERPAVQSFYEELVRTKGTAVYEHKVIGPDGSPRWQLWTDKAIVNNDGHVVAIQAVGLDITERKQAEDALRESEARYRLLAENIKDVILKLSPDGIFTFISPSSFGLTGHQPEELIGLPAMSVVHPEDVPVAMASIIQTMSSGATFFTVNQRVPHKDGHYVWVEISNTIVRDSQTGVPLEVLGVMRDITERKQAEAALKQTLAQEKELGELKSRFVSMASHEFRTPLAAILATTETLTVYRERMDRTQIDARLHKIRQQVGHMKEIMDDVLQLARIQAGRVEFKPAPGDMDALCREVVEEFDSQVAYHGRIQYTPPSSPFPAKFDDRLLRQVITNLIANALKYSPRETAIQVHLYQEKGHIQLTVRDEGIGIPAPDLKRLFEPFHRAANVGTISGTGLGLSITKQAVELHGGTIVPESQVGKGTTFTVILPQIWTSAHTNEATADDLKRSNTITHQEINE